MQTLPAGSFLNFENDSAVETLKFTARLLAEHTEKVVKENLSNASLENLANNLWQKAEYVTRETERRRLQQIFVENFTERFRELKPDFDALTNRINDSFNQAGAPEEVENSGEQDIESENNSSTEQIPAAQAQKDVFLGVVKSDELLSEPATEDRETRAPATEEVKQTAAESAAETKPEVVKTQNKSGTPQTTIPEGSEVSKEVETVPENNKADGLLQQTVQNNSRTENPVKSGTSSLEAKEEPFEFGKCTVNLNLVLLPCSNNSASRKVIISTVSHALTPEIEYLEIETGEDLEQIASLVKDKLARFRGTLPVKYIEQLRASKNKTTKANQTTKSTAPVTSSEKTSGEQKMSGAAHSQSEVKSDEQTAEKESEAAFSVVATPPPVPMNERVQPSLF